MLQVHDGIMQFYNLTIIVSDLGSNQNRWHLMVPASEMGCNDECFNVPVSKLLKASTIQFVLSGLMF